MMTPEARDLLRRQLKYHEGSELVTYLDTEGILTVGCGHNCEASPTYHIICRAISKVGDTITLEEEKQLLDHDIDTAMAGAEKVVPEFDDLSPSRQAVIVDMVFNLGAGRLVHFSKMLEAVSTQDWTEAATEMLDSHWAEQVGSRATRLALMMRDDLSFRDALIAVP